MHKRVKSNKKSSDIKSLNEIKREVTSKHNGSGDRASETSGFTSPPPFCGGSGDTPFRRSLRFLSYTLFAFALIPFLNYASITRERMQLKPPGKLYNIGHHGQRMFMNCTGKGAPTVILESPIGYSSDVWFKVQDKLSKFTTVCSYDRAGIGFSDRALNESLIDEDKQEKAAHPSTIERMTDDLYRLITAATSQPKPFVFVAAETSSLNARFFAQLYQNDVAHVVLVEPIGEHLENDDSWVNHWFNDAMATYQIKQLSAALGINRLALIVRSMEVPMSDVYDETHIVNKRQKHLLCNPKHLSSVVDEHFFINESFSQMNIIKSIRKISVDIGVTIITGDKHDAALSTSMNKVILNSQMALLSEIGHAKHISVQASDRTMIYKRPYSVIDPVKNIVRQWRKANPQTSDE